MLLFTSSKLRLSYIIIIFIADYQIFCFIFTFTIHRKKFKAVFLGPDRIPDLWEPKAEHSIYIHCSLPWVLAWFCSYYNFYTLISLENQWKYKRRKGHDVSNSVRRARLWCQFYWSQWGGANHTITYIFIVSTVTEKSFHQIKKFTLSDVNLHFLFQCLFSLLLGSRQIMALPIIIWETTGVTTKLWLQWKIQDIVSDAMTLGSFIFSVDWSRKFCHKTEQISKGFISVITQFWPNL